MSTTPVQQAGFEDEGDMVKNKGEGVMKCVEEKEKGEVGGVKKSKGKSKNPSQPPARYIFLKFDLWGVLSYFTLPLEKR